MAAKGKFNGIGTCLKGALPKIFNDDMISIIEDTVLCARSSTSHQLFLPENKSSVYQNEFLSGHVNDWFIWVRESEEGFVRESQIGVREEKGKIESSMSRILAL